MEYFSELNITKKEEYADRTYHGFEEQLLWRYEDLKDRYSEIQESELPCSIDVCFSDDDYRYAPVKCFKSTKEVYRAMEITKEDLLKRCGIIVRDDENIENEEDEEDPDQMTVFEIVLLPTWFQTAAAA